MGNGGSRRGAGGWLAGPPIPSIVRSGAAGAPAAREAPGADEPPRRRRRRKQRIGEYQTVRTLKRDGMYGRTLLSEHVTTGERVVLRVVKKERIAAADKVRLKEQTLAFRDLCSDALNLPPSVVVLQAVLASKTKVYCVYDAVHDAMGSLLELLVRMGSLPEDEARQIFRQLVRGVFACHRRGIYAASMDLGDVLLVRGSDMGERRQARMLSLGAPPLPRSEQRRQTGAETTPDIFQRVRTTPLSLGTCPPEVLLGAAGLRRALLHAADGGGGGDGSGGGSDSDDGGGGGAMQEQDDQHEQADDQVDAGLPDELSTVWRLGAMLHAMCAGRYPFHQHGLGNAQVQSMAGVVAGMCRDARDTAAIDGTSESLHALLCGMLAPDRARRAGLEDVMRHPWVDLPVGEAMPAPEAPEAPGAEQQQPAVVAGGQVAGAAAAAAAPSTVRVTGVTGGGPSTGHCDSSSGSRNSNSSSSSSSSSSNDSSSGDDDDDDD